MPIIAPPLIPSGTLILRWVDPGGLTRALVGNPYVTVLTGVLGLGYVTASIDQDKLPTSPGTIVRHVSISPDGRRVVMPLYIKGGSEAELQQMVDIVYGWFATANEATQTPGYLQVKRRDDTWRQCAFYYTGGMEGDLGAATALGTGLLTSVHLLAPDPMPSAITSVEQEWTNSILDVVQFVLNTGEEDGYPIWTVVGPASSPFAITNLTTGASIVMLTGLALSAGQTLTIDTRPPEQRSGYQVYDQAGVNRYALVSAQSALWPLKSGTNRVVIGAAGTTSTTRFKLRYRPRYRGILL